MGLLSKLLNANQKAHDKVFGIGSEERTRADRAARRRGDAVRPRLVERPDQCPRCGSDDIGKRGGCSTPRVYYCRESDCDWFRK